MSKEFAPEYKRNEQGLIIFPRDKKDRDELFVQKSYSHVAKANLYVVEELVKYCSDVGDTVLDPFGGTGTILIAGTMGRTVGVIELNPNYVEIIQNNAEKADVAPVLQRGPCQEHLKSWRDVDAIITSPPYAQMMHKGGGIAASGKYGDELEDYMADVRQPNGISYNLGQLNNFLYTQEMDKIYRLCFNALRPGGYFALIIKDRASKGIRIELGMASTQKLVGMGFVMDRWERWLPPGTQFVQIHKKQGHFMIEDEHLIIVRRPE